MNTHEFTLIVEGPDLQEEPRIDALFEAGIVEAVIARIGSLQYVGFDREAESFADAVFSATKSLESVPGIRAAHLEPDDLMTMSEIAERVGRTRESVRLLVSGDRGPGGFSYSSHALSESSADVAWQEVALWLVDKLGEAPVLDDPEKSAVNAGLKWREVDKDHQDRIGQIKPTHPSAQPLR